MGRAFRQCNRALFAEQANRTAIRGNSVNVRYLVNEILNQGTPLQKIAPQKVVITVGKPIAVTERWDPSYKVDHQRFKQARRELNQDIKAGLEVMIPATTH